MDELECEIEVHSHFGTLVARQHGAEGIVGRAGCHIINSDVRRLQLLEAREMRRGNYLPIGAIVLAALTAQAIAAPKRPAPKKPAATAPSPLESGTSFIIYDVGTLRMTG